MVVTFLGRYSVAMKYNTKTMEGYRAKLQPPKNSKNDFGINILYMLSAASATRICYSVRSDLGAYGVSATVGLLTYVVYGALNSAWANPALAAIALYMFLFIPGYSKVSNWIEGQVSQRVGLETAGRTSRYLAQLGVNLVLLWVFLAGGILEHAGLVALGGFFGAAAWITVVSQGGQYLATWLARNGLGGADLNVVLAVATSAVVSALAVSGVAWVQPIYMVVSLGAGFTILASGVLSDLRLTLARQSGRALP